MTHEIKDNVTMLARAAVNRELEKKKLLGQPAYVYDRKDKVVYKINPDGTREKASNRLREGRYSEQLTKEKQKS